MYRVLAGYVGFTDRMTERVGKSIRFILFAMLFVMLFEAFTRYVLHVAMPWTLDMMSFMLATYFFIGGGYTLLRGAHVKLDIFYTRWSVKRQAIVNLATFFLVPLYFIAFILGGIDNIGFALRTGQKGMTSWGSFMPWGPPLAPVKIILVIGATLLLSQLVAHFIRDLCIVRGKPLK